MARWVLSFCAMLLFVTATTAAAAGTQAGRTVDERRIAFCIEQASQGHAWLSKTLWGLRDKEDGWVGAAVRNTNGTDDLGPLQVNSWWVRPVASLVNRKPEAVRRWLQHDPCFNVDVARWIFLTALAAEKDYWKAIGVYHSPVSWRQQRYALDVAQRLSRRFGTSVFARSDGRQPAGAAASR